MPQPGYNFNIIPMGVAAKQAIPPTTERLLIIGPALDGPVNTPVQLTDGNAAISIFGPMVYNTDYADPNTAAAGVDSQKVWTGNYLVRAFLEAQAAGAANIYLVRTGGLFATGSSTVLTDFQPRSKSPGYCYNTQVLSSFLPSLTNSTTASSVTFTLNQKTSKGGVITKTFLAAETVADVVTWFAAPQTATSNGTFEFDCNSLVKLIASATTLGSSSGLAWTLSGSTNGTSVKGELGAHNRSTIYNSLIANYGTFDLLKDFQFDVAVLTGIYLDDKVAADVTTSVASAFAGFLQDVSDRTRPCFGVIGCRPINETRLDRLTKFINDNYLSIVADDIKINSSEDTGAYWNAAGGIMKTGFKRTYSDGSIVDMGNRMAVFAGPDFIRSNSSLGYYNDNGAVTYAAFLTTLAPSNAATLQQVPGIFALGTSFPRDLVDDLVTGVTINAATKEYGPAYVCAKSDPDLGGIVFADDPTAGWRNTEFSQHQPVHVVNLAARRIREVTQPFIGHANEESTRAAISTGIRNKLEQLANLGALQGGEGIGYSFVVSADPMENILGIVNITLSLRPAFSIRTINVTIMVRE